MNLTAETFTAQLAHLALRLHQVKEAYRNFVSLGAVQCMAEDVDGMQRLMDELDALLAADAVEESPFHKDSTTVLHFPRILDD